MEKHEAAEAKQIQELAFLRKLEEEISQIPNDVFYEKYKANEFLAVVLGFPIISRLFIGDRYLQLSKIFDQSVTTQAAYDEKSIRLYTRSLDAQIPQLDDADLYLAIYSDFKNAKLKRLKGSVLQDCYPPERFRFVFEKDGLKVVFGFTHSYWGFAGMPTTYTHIGFAGVDIIEEGKGRSALLDSSFEPFSKEVALTIIKIMEQVLVIWEKHKMKLESHIKEEQEKRRLAKISKEEQRKHTRENEQRSAIEQANKLLD